MGDLWKKLVVAAFVAALGGSGWVMYFVKQQDARQAEVQAEAKEALKGFLSPLEMIIDQNQKIHSSLTQDPELRNLEYAPDRVRDYFVSLPDTDWRKIGWENAVQLLLRNNERAIKYIEENSGLIVSQDFRECSKDYIAHARLWGATWHYVIGDQPQSEKVRGAGRLLTPEFPECMDSLLGLEIKERRRQLGYEVAQ